jgi:hypothetical protein
LARIFSPELRKRSQGRENQPHNMINPTTPSSGEDVLFVNRDHIISVVIHQGEIVVTTTAGEKMTIPVSTAILEKFVDDLANNIESNFVSVSAAPSPSG